MKTSYLIGAAALTLVAVPALALQQSAAPEAKQGMKRGMVMADTRIEVEAKVRERFQAMDADKDGSVTQAEMQAQRSAMRAERRDKMFAKLDADSNGQISKAEFTAERQRGDRAERPEGARKHGGWHKGRGGMGKGMGGFAWLDADKDGKVTLAEASARPLAHFDAIDTDKNGQISDAERTAAREAMKAKWKERRG